MNELNKQQYLEVENLIKSEMAILIKFLEKQDIKIEGLTKEIHNVNASVLMLQVKNGLIATFIGAITSFITAVSFILIKKI